MVKYSVLKQGNHGLPSWDGLLGPVMVTAISKPRWDRRELIAAVVASIDLPDVLLKKKLSDEHTGTIIDDRVSWAMSELTIHFILFRRHIQQTGNFLGKNFQIIEYGDRLVILT